MNKQEIKIELLQGNNAPIVLMSELNKGLKNSEVSGTLAFRIIKLMLTAKKHKMNLGGFSFARKFDVKISINGVSADGTRVLGLNSIKFGIALQSNESSAQRFNDFIVDLVNDILCGDSELEGDFPELLDELELKKVIKGELVMS